MLTNSCNSRSGCHLSVLLNSTSAVTFWSYVEMQLFKIEIPLTGTAHKSERRWRDWFLQVHQKDGYFLWLGPKCWSQLYKHKVIVGASAFSGDNCPGRMLHFFWDWELKGVRETLRREAPIIINSNNSCGYLGTPDIMVQLSSDCTQLSVGSLCRGWRRIFHFMHHLQLPSIIQPSQYRALMHS